MDCWNGFFDICSVIYLLAIFSVGCFEKGQNQVSKSPIQTHNGLKPTKSESEHRHNRIDLFLLRLLIIKDKLARPIPRDPKSEIRQRIQSPTDVTRRLETVKVLDNNDTDTVHNSSKTFNIRPNNESNMDLLSEIVNVVSDVTKIFQNNETKKTFHKNGDQRIYLYNEISKIPESKRIIQGKTKTIDTRNKNGKTSIQKERSKFFAHNEASKGYSQSESNSFPKSESNAIFKSESKIVLQSEGNVSQIKNNKPLTQSKIYKTFLQTKGNIFLQSNNNYIISQSERNKIVPFNKISKIFSQRKSRKTSKSEKKIFLQSKTNNILIKSKSTENAQSESKENVQTESSKIFSNHEASNIVRQNENRKIFTQTESRKILTNSESSKKLAQSESRKISQSETSKIFPYHETNKIVHKRDSNSISQNRTSKIFHQSERKISHSESSKIFTHNKSRTIVHQNESSKISIQSKHNKILSDNETSEILPKSESRKEFQKTKANNTILHHKENNKNLTNKGIRTIVNRHETSTTSTRNEINSTFHGNSNIFQNRIRTIGLNSESNKRISYESRRNSTFNETNKGIFNGFRNVVPNSETKDVFSQREVSKILTHSEASNKISHSKVGKTVFYNETDNTFIYRRTGKILPHSETSKIIQTNETNKISYHKNVHRVFPKNSTRKILGKTIYTGTKRMYNRNKTGNVDPNLPADGILSYEKNQKISIENEADNRTAPRKKRYNYEDTYEWEEDEKLLEYDVDEDSLVQKIGRHWKKVAASLCFVCAGLILACIIGRLACTICWPQIKAACFLTYCPLLDFIKSQYDILCRDDSDKLERDFRTVANMLGIKLTIEDFKAIKEHYGFDKGKNFQDPNTLRGAAKKWEVDVGVPII